MKRFCRQTDAVDDIICARRELSRVKFFVSAIEGSHCHLIKALERGIEASAEVSLEPLPDHTIALEV
ncbi:hypothetical protein DL93DRAFT_2073538 [Clavulina sp. PMI_390]|nr:hypothetical protein DL93DRAFT_2073538 [Clavulina sp. PMI_390]